MAQTEVWKDIEGYEHMYQVSNKGRVKSLERKVNTMGGKKRTQPPSILKQNITNGYYYVDLSKKGTKERRFIHRLVAESFIENVDNLQCVNHIDENRLNNDISNLEWCTYSQNRTSGTVNLRIINSFKQQGITRKVNQYDKNSHFLQSHESVAEASKNTKVNRTSIISCCKERYKQAGGYIWRYADENN